MSYKDAYDYWTEERLKLNKEVLEATDQVLEKVPIAQITSQLSFFAIERFMCSTAVHNEFFLF